MQIDNATYIGNVMECTNNIKIGDSTIYYWQAITVFNRIMFLHFYYRLYNIIIMYFKFFYYFLERFQDNCLHTVGWIFVMLFVVHKHVKNIYRKATKKK